ncbi:MAG TPA: hypothetical protein VLK30_09860 [Candidatus Limnocylindrales bacterium]|nr:hypothetical protein [Candidatus Limnocylindrales bacterium]
MQIPRPPAVGDQSVVQQLRSVLFSEPILGAARVRPKGYLWVILGHAGAWWAGGIARVATRPLPPTILYLAVTPVDVRLFSKPPWSDPYEIGRWKKSSYRASIRESDRKLKLDVDLPDLGRATIIADRNAQPVVDMFIAGSSGPVLPTTGT